MIEETQSLQEYVTQFIRDAHSDDTCCGISYIVDGHDDINASLFIHPILGSALTLHIESHCHCPVCDNSVTMLTQFRIADNRVDIIEKE